MIADVHPDEPLNDLHTTVWAAIQTLRGPDATGYPAKVPHLTIGYAADECDSDQVQRKLRNEVRLGHAPMRVDAVHLVDVTADAQAKRHYLASLRAAGHTDDRAVGATVLAFWAGLRYNRNDPHGALGILDAVTATAGRRTGSPRVTALLHARTARAHAKAGNRYGAHHEPPRPTRTCPRCTGSPTANCTRWRPAPPLTWVSTVGRWSTSRPPVTPTIRTTRRRSRAGPRSTRRAETHLALGEIDAAVDLARQAVDRMGGTASARGSSTITALRGKLAAHRAIPDVRDFLAATA
ncbi:MAG: 2'-5' RNA ligase family protein [Streptomycetaceae bacterium]|nr:2'-5' RNA ligase family protein [Streptomycetaceae bacterium]